jgi:hypothetical protein
MAAPAAVQQASVRALALVQALAVVQALVQVQAGSF